MNVDLLMKAIEKGPVVVLVVIVWWEISQIREDLQAISASLAHLSAYSEICKKN